MKCAAAVLLAVAVLVLAGGCLWLKDSTRTTPASVELNSEVYSGQDETGAPIWSRKSAKAVGPSVAVKQDGGAADFDSTVPEVSINGMTGKAGGTALGVKNAFAKALQTPLALGVLGGLAVIAGAVLGILTKSAKAALPLVGVGVLLIGLAVVAETAPWVYWIAALAALAAAGYLGWRYWKTDLSLRLVARAVEKSDHAGEVKTAVALASRDDPGVKATIGEAKTREGV
ncbi:MAG TPA: hypothetical protein VM219_09060 [Phycisphaerae bacterium]|nr:hypothetical protein [Phycisphaerae bacterium]